MVERFFAGGRQYLIRLLLRAHDTLSLVGSVIVVLAASSGLGAEGCPAAWIALPPIVLALAAYALGVPLHRFPYGSVSDLVSTGASIGAAGIATLVAWKSSNPCGAYLLASWLVPAALIATPRLLVAVFLDRAGKRREDTSDTPRPAVRLSSAGHTNGRTAWIITLSRPVDEPRVRRQANALSHGGWNVVAVGYKGIADQPAFWTMVELPAGMGPGLRIPRLVELFTLSPFMKLLALIMARFSESCAERYYWLEGRHEENFRILLETAMTAGIPCHLIAHHDFDSLGIAARLAARLGVPFTTDAHEYARGQYMHSLRFRLLNRHYVHSLQKRLFPKAALLTVVCEGIANLLHREYPLRRQPLVVRNVSFYEAMPFRPTAERIRVTYHGILYPTRGLEEAIRSLPLWRSEFELVIRGPGPNAYIESLHRLARWHGVESRVRFEPVVPLTELVAVANQCDIGFFASPDYSPQKLFTAPNKLFEYLMAGLALCVSDLPEMRRVVIEHDIGRLFKSLDPEAIAQAINGFTRDSIDQYKRRSLEAAKILCWEQERKPLIDAYSDICRAEPGSVPHAHGQNGAYQTHVTRC